MVNAIFLNRNLEMAFGLHRNMRLCLSKPDIRPWMIKTLKLLQELSRAYSSSVLILRLFKSCDNFQGIYRTRFPKFILERHSTQSHIFLKPTSLRSLSFDGHDKGSRAGDEAPLSGVRILDMTRVLAGPYCTMLLADLGAEVIKVERPGCGDDTRSWGPPFIGTESCYFMCVNRNKKSVTVDNKKPEGVKLVRELAAISDVLVENYIPGKLSEFGLGYPELSKLFPSLIYCSITGYGQTGSYASRAGYDVIVSGTGGLMHITGPPDGKPCKVGVAITDMSTGLYAVSSILASLFARFRTGKGQHIDCNLLSTNVASLANIASNYINAGQEAQRFGTAHPSIVPYQAFKTADGYFLVGAGNDSQFAVLAKLIGHPELTDNKKFLTNKDRVQHREELLSFLSSVFKEKPLSDWLTVFEKSGIPHGPINNMEQVFSHPQVLHNGLLQTIPHPTLGEVKVVGPAVRYSGTPTVSPVAPPLLGQHTDQVLTQLLSYSPDQVAELRNSKVI